MIIFDLSCHDGHRFEGWFRSADDFTAQSSRGLLACPHCGSSEVRRLPSATHIASGGASPHVPALPERNAANLLGEAVKRMLALAEDVGRAFPEEARRIHYREATMRPIFGEATADECEALREEGIDILRFPAKKPTDLN